MTSSFSFLYPTIVWARSLRKILLKKQQVDKESIPGIKYLLNLLYLHNSLFRTHIEVNQRLANSFRYHRCDNHNYLTISKTKDLLDIS